MHLKEEIQNALAEYDKKIDDLDEERVKRLQYLTRKAEFANLLYLTSKQYCSSDFFANLFWLDREEYNNIDRIIKYERAYVQCCASYENNEKSKANRLACDLIAEYKELMSEPPYTTCSENNPMKNFVRMRLSDVYFYKNMTASGNEFNMKEAEASVQYYQEVIDNPSEMKTWDDEILAYFYNSQGYMKYYMSKHILSGEEGRDYLEEALVKLKDAVAKAPYKGRYKRNLGLVYQAMNNYEEARRIYKEAVRDDPCDYKAYNTVAALDLKEFDKESGISNRNETLLDKMIFTEEIQQKWKKCIDEDIMLCKKAEKICFSFVDTHYNMAKAYLYKYLCEGKSDIWLLKQAHEQIDIAESLDSQASGTLFTKRNIYEAEGNLKKALECADVIGNRGDNIKLKERYNKGL